MSKLVLGIATMNGGYGMPGAALKETLKCMPYVHKVVIVDGALGDEGREFYKENCPDAVIVDSPWAESLKVQYDALLKHMDDGDWWLMLDDDEVTSWGLNQFLLSMKMRLDDDKPAIDNPDVFSLSTPRVTSFPDPECPAKYYMGEEVPVSSGQTGPNVAGPRAHIFKVCPEMQMMHSKAGRHVVPYYPNRAAAYLVGEDIFHAHLKAPELYVYNDCVKAMFDDDIKDPAISQEYRDMLNHCGIKTSKDFTVITTKGQVTQEFKDFCLKYRGYGAPEGRLFIWYYNICHPELNPTNQTWTDSLKLVLNENWRKTFKLNKLLNQYHEVSYVTPYPSGHGEILV